MIRFDLKWGNPIVVHQALIDTIGELQPPSLSKLGDYPWFTGNDDLISLTQSLMFKLQINQYIGYMFITNGATGAIDAAINITKRHYPEVKYLFLRKGPIFPLYANIAKNHNLKITHTKKDYKTINLCDVPSAPEGNFDVTINSRSISTIWDASYSSPTYADPTNYANNLGLPEITAFSFSKLLGLPGLRLGALSTIFNYEVATNVLAGMYCGVSDVSQQIASQALYKLLEGSKYNEFFKLSKQYIDDNRNEFYKVRHLFKDNINEFGMFYYTKVDYKLSTILNQLGVSYMTGADLYDKRPNMIRLNLAQDRNVVRELVKELQKI